MAETKIEWAATVRPDGTTVPGYTFNPWRGCTKVSDGCRSCYADTMSKRNPGTLGVWGPNGTRVVAAESYWRLPVKWDREAAVAGERRRVLCASLADVFEDWRGIVVGTDGEPRYERDGRFVEAGEDDSPAPGESGIGLETVRRRLFKLIDATPNLDWLLVTKRPENITRMMPERSPRRQCPAGVSDVYRPNVWLGTSVENQATADERIPHLLRVPAAVRFLSMEPLLGPVNLNRDWLGEYRREHCSGCERISEEEVDCPGHEVGGIGWVIVGGESGPGARPMHPNWVRSIRDQCQAAGVPFHFKQWGEYAPLDAGGNFSVGDKKAYSLDELGRLNKQTGGITLNVRRVGKKDAGRLLDGRTWDEVPEVAGG